MNYELNPPFAVFCSNKGCPADSDDTGSSSVVRYESLVAGHLADC